MINIDDFKKIEIRIGEILSVEKVENTDKLLKLSVDFGFKKVLSSDNSLESETGDTVFEKEKEIRTIVSGISMYFDDINDLVGKKCAFVTNLEPRKLKGIESNGMILAVSDENNFSLLEVGKNIPNGLGVR